MCDIPRFVKGVSGLVDCGFPGLIERQFAGGDVTHAWDGVVVLTHIASGFKGCFGDT